MQRDAPRNVRDIAHLYLSRMRPAHGRAARLVIAGVSSDVIPGFHTANLALTAAAAGMNVRIVEASGLPVSAGCFLGLDPGCWVVDGCPAEAMVSAFARVSFMRASCPGGEVLAASNGNGSGDVLEIVHAPPWDTAAEHVHMVENASAGPAVLLYLAERDEPPWPWLEWDHVVNVTARVGFVARPRGAPANADCAGVITRWRAALTDPLPAVLRDPGSRLSRQYHDVLSSLLADTRARLRDQPGHHHATVPTKSL